MFREQEHPRDNKGKFTFKNGRNSSTSTLKNATQALYGKKSKEEKLQKERRSELLSKLKDKLTPAQILYSSNDELEKIVNKKGEMTGGASGIGNTQGNWQKPVEYQRINSPYGWRIHPIQKTKKFHTGIDLSVPQGTKVKIPMDGVVEFAGEKGGYGYVVIINHGKINDKIVETKYAHLSKYDVKKGDVVKGNSSIGLSGGKKGTPGAGTSTGAHLHFEVLENDKFVNPMTYLKH